MRNVIANQTFDEERALYNLQDSDVIACRFEGPQDGESALKEARNITVKDTFFSLRYPLWHVQNYHMSKSTLDDKTRAPIWYSRDGIIEDCVIHGVKCLRECDGAKMVRCNVQSPEFGWRCRNIAIEDSHMESEYFLFECRNVEIDKLEMKGKYSFQYVENMHIKNSVLDTKDAFWHGKNITVENSVIKGEYLAWFSEGLTLINCKIIGTQPLCYCKDLKLINCTMEGTDLAFEYSDVEADIKGHVDSVKNPRSGKITLDSVGDIIWDGSIMDTRGEIVIREK